MQLDIVAITIVIISNLVLGGFVLSRNFRNKVNVIFAFLAMSVALWSFFNLYTNHAPTSILLVVNQLAFTSSLIMIYAIWLFSANFPPGQRSHRIQKLILYPLLLISLPLSLTKYTIAEVIYRPEKSVTDIVTGSLYPVYIVALLAFLLFIIKNFIVNYRASNAIVRNQMKFMITGILFAFIWGAITSAIIPAITGDWVIAKYGPVGTLALVGGMAYAIIRHRLFDIRLVVARALGYALSILALAAVYGVVAFAVVDTFIFTNSTSVVTQQIVYTFLAVILAFTFRPLKRFFDKLTNKLFYQDAYETQSLLNDLNSSLVSSIDVASIMKNTSLLLEHYLKPEYVGFYVYKTNKMDGKSFNTDDKKSIPVDDIQKITDEITDQTIDLSSASNLKDDVQKIISANNISMATQLVSREGKNEVIGTLILGQKKSGSIYGRQDFKMMEIVADELVIALQNATRFEEIQQFNITLQQKVDDATEQLRSANQKLIAMDQTKDDFISMASHQLRTPLTSVKGYVSMVLEGDVGKISDQQRKLLDQSFLSAQRMVYLIADLLNVSRLKTGKFVIESKPTNLAEIVEGELAQLKETAAARKLEIKYDKPKDFPMLDMDETKIRQVIMNFADNAIYYTSSGGHIKVVVADRGDSVECTVTDDGIGVPKAEQHNLFNKFYRAGNARKARPDGTGLGLFMAKKVVVAQGGEIIFKSEEGKGSTFGFRFDKKKLTPGTRTVKFDEEDEATGVDETAKKEHTRRSTKDAEQQGSSEPQP